LPLHTSGHCGECGPNGVYYTADKTSRSVEVSAALGERHNCQRCGELLNNHNIAWLELSTSSGLYYESGYVPTAESQGFFPFGVSCARAVVKAGGKLKRIRGAA
jgi:hypothetical protein